MKKDKTSKAFDQGISILAILTFSVILLDSIFNLTWLTANIGNILIFGAGILFLIEGKVILVFNQLKKGKIKRKMIPKVFVVLVGLVATIFGALGLIGVSGTFLNTIRGGLSLSAIIVIVLETWIIE